MSIEESKEAMVGIDRLVDGLVQDLVDRVSALEGGRIRTSGWRSLVESFAREIQREALEEAALTVSDYADRGHISSMQRISLRSATEEIRALMSEGE